MNQAYFYLQSKSKSGLVILQKLYFVSYLFFSLIFAILL